MDTFHILVVEDDPDINNLLCRIVTGAGYDCRPAFSGSEAALLAEKYSYDLILLDLMLPGLTGEEFIARLRQGKTMPIIVLSAKAGVEARVNVLKLGRTTLSPSPLRTLRCWPASRHSCAAIRSSRPPRREACSPAGAWCWIGRA